MHDRAGALHDPSGPRALGQRARDHLGHARAGRCRAGLGAAGVGRYRAGPGAAGRKLERVEVELCRLVVQKPERRHTGSSEVS